MALTSENRFLPGTNYSRNLAILGIIERYAPRRHRENRLSVRGRYSMACPLPDHDDAEHPDGSGSFSVDAEQDLYYCFGCGGSGNALTLRRILSGGRSTAPDVRPSTRNRVNTTRQPFQGVTLEQLVKAKGLNLAYVQDFLGWTDVDYFGTPAVLIPYRDHRDSQVQIRYRVGLNSGERFRWQKGAKTMPYGLWMLRDYRTKGFDYIVVVEGETDFATLGSRGYPVLAVPGASAFQAAWATFLKEFNDIYLWVEADTGGDTLKNKLASEFPRLKAIEAPPYAKDPSELAQISDDFEHEFRTLMDSAVMVPPGVRSSQRHSRNYFPGRFGRGRHYLPTIEVGHRC